MSGFHGKGGDADCDVFGSFCFGSAVLDPLAGMSDHRLACVNIKRAIAMSDTYRPLQNQSVFLERWCLARFDPTGCSLGSHKEENQKILRARS